MNALDAGILAVLTIFLVLGAFSGFIKGISSLVSLAAGLLLANRYMSAASTLLLSLGLPDAHGVIGYLITFGIFYLGLKVVFLLVRKLSHASGLNAQDRVLGGLLGLIKGGIIAMLLLSLLQLSLPGNSIILKRSRLLPYVNKTIVISKGMVPEGLVARIPKIRS